MNELRELSLFSGYGGFSLGLKLTGIPTRTVMYVEWERYPQEIIKARINDKILNDAPIWGNISTLNGEQFRGVVDIITGGFPCQPHSVAGLRRGADDERNLWPETLRIIREVGPRYVLLENVTGILSASSDGGRPAYGGTVVGQLAQAGYRIRWETVGADDVGATHKRKRWLCFGELENPDRGRFEQRQPEAEPQTSASQPSERNDGELGDSDINAVQGVEQGTQQGEHQRQVGLSDRTACQPTWPPSPSDAHAWERVIRERPDLAPALTKKAEQQFRGMDNGRSHRVDELKALGNGIVPACVAEFLKRVSGLV